MTEFKSLVEVVYDGILRKDWHRGNVLWTWNVIKIKPAVMRL